MEREIAFQCVLRLRQTFQADCVPGCRLCDVVQRCNEPVRRESVDPVQHVRVCGDTVEPQLSLAERRVRTLVGLSLQDETIHVGERFLVSKLDNSFCGQDNGCSVRVEVTRVLFRSRRTRTVRDDLQLSNFVV